MGNSITVALAGNPNAGKTTLFNALTGARQHVGNWPGVTVEKKEGSLFYKDRNIHVIDLPGTYSLTAFSLEEIIARNFIVDCLPDVVINVVDASNLERNLYLSVQLMEMGVKLVMALNMIDVAEGRNIKIDVAKLSGITGVPIVATNGKKGIGIADLLQTIVHEADSFQQEKPKFIQYGTELEEELELVRKELDKATAESNRLSHQWLALKLLEGDTEVVEKFRDDRKFDALFSQIEKSRIHLNNVFQDSPEILMADARYGFITGALKQSVQTQSGDRVHLSETIDTVLTNRLFGPIILLTVLYGVYVFTFQGSDIFVQALEHFFKWLSGIAESNIPDGLLKSLVVSGIIHGVGGVLGFTPLIAFMFFAIAFLEDTGYMARIAFMLDRVLRGFGLHGASMLALLVSGGLAGGCAVPGIMATRTMKEPKERLVTILVAPLMNCGAKLPVYALLIGAFFSTGKAQMMFLLTVISWVLALTAAKIIRSTVLSGPTAPFVLELPPYRMPTLKGLLIHTWERTWMYVKKAGTLILAVSVVLWAMMTFPELPTDRSNFFQTKEEALTVEFLGNSAVKQFLSSSEQLGEFQTYLKNKDLATSGNSKNSGENFRKMADAVAGSIQGNPELTAFASAFNAYTSARNDIEGQKQSDKVQNTIGGRVGISLEYVLGPLGFDWRTNVALIGGFAAKEVVVATLGTAYSLGQINTDEPDSLAEQLKKEPGWNRLQAFTLILFVMLYNPCLTTLVVIKRESGKWRWMIFAMVYTTLTAYFVAFTVRTIGTLLNLGT